jgi:hypothetical protein
MARAASSPRVVVFLQENKTPDFSFRSMAAFGADIAEYEAARVLSAAPDYDQPHDRNAWVHFRIGDYAAVRTQLDNDKIQPLHAWLAKNFTFCDHHFAIGSNSTSGHLLTIGGQTPTLKNPPFGPGGPTWDMPSIFVHAERNGLTWAAVHPSDVIGYRRRLRQARRSRQFAATDLRLGAEWRRRASAVQGLRPRLPEPSS